MSSTSSKNSRVQQPRLLLSVNSYSSHGSNSSTSTSASSASSSNGTGTYNSKSSSSKENNNTFSSMSPPLQSCLLTGIVFVSFLTLSEQFGRYVIYQNQHYHVLLEDERNRQILARHIFVDTMSCTICAILGYMSRYESFYPIMKGTIPLAAYDQRLFTYMPNGFRLTLFFFWYQVKNLVDTILWNDGPEYIFHHVFSLITAYGAMNPGCGHVYTLFFFGLSEISTAVLCLLANFDDHHGVVGLGDAFPITKIICGAIFVVLFILCRCILWPIHSYYFCNDILHAIRNTNDPRATSRRSWMIFFLISLSGLSVLQIAWLGQIFMIGKEELQKSGFV
jgi:hypothetical protein